MSDHYDDGPEDGDVACATTPAQRRRPGEWFVGWGSKGGGPIVQGWATPAAGTAGKKMVGLVWGVGEEASQIALMLKKEADVAARALKELRAALLALHGPAFSEELQRLPLGDEEHVLGRSAHVARLARSISRTGEAAAVLEAEFDRLFEEFRTGQVFVHSELVMSMLVAARLAGASWLSLLAAPLAQANAAELKRVSRLAARLLQS